MLATGTGARAHPISERGVDLYETPDVAVDALVDAVNITNTRASRPIWEPACGPGRLADRLRYHGYPVMGSDLVGYGQPIIRDFFDFEAPLHNIDLIVTNPPFKDAQAFVEHSLKLCPRVIMLLRLAFLESQRRTPILENAGLEWVMPFAKRLPMMHREGWEGRKANSGMAFAWFVWDRGYSGDPKIKRLHWEQCA